MIVHGNKQMSEMVYSRKASDGGGAVRLTNIIRGAQVVFGGLYPNVYGWLRKATKAAILAAFGQTEGYAVIGATNAYLNGIEATDQTKAKALAGFINEDPMLVCSLMELGITRWIKTTGANQFFITDIKQTASRQLVEKAVVKYDKTGVRRLTGISGSNAEYWGVQSNNTFEKVTASQSDISKKTNTTYSYTQTNTVLKIFAITDTGMYSNSGCYRNETKLYLSGNLVRNYVPFKKNGQMELLDLVSMELCTRVGTLAESFDDAQGNPWTPAS